MEYLNTEFVYNIDSVLSTNQLNVYGLDLPVKINLNFKSTIAPNGYF